MKNMFNVTTHRFASHPLANEPLHSSQLFDTSLQKARGTSSICGPWAALHFRAHIVKLCRALSEDLCRKVVTSARVRLQKDVRQNGGWSHWTCSSLGTIFQPMRINSVPGVKCFCNNKSLLRAQSMVWHFVRH